MNNEIGNITLTEDGITFTCGSSMEMLIDNEWELGYICHDDAYYFLSNGGEKVYLSEGMNIRHRK